MENFVPFLFNHPCNSIGGETFCVISIQKHVGVLDWVSKIIDKNQKEEKSQDTCKQ